MIKSLAKAMLRSNGLKVVPQQARIESSYRDMSHPHSYVECEDFTNSIYTTYKPLKCIIKNNIEGGLVESGVYTGALTVQTLGDTFRRLYMYDACSGIPEPSEKGYDHNQGQSAGGKFNPSGASQRHGPLS